MDNSIPTFEQLQKRKIVDSVSKDIDYKLLHVIVSLLNIFPWFNKFLIENNYDEEYELTTIIFGQIINYIEFLIESDNKNEIVRILFFLDTLSLSNDNQIINLVSIWFLENLDNHKNVLLFIIEIMPYNLRLLFMKWYSHYLD